MPPVHRTSVSLIACVIALSPAMRVQAGGEPQHDAKKKHDAMEHGAMEQGATSESDESEGKAPSSAGKPQGRPQTVPVDLQRLGTQLELYAADANRARLASTLIGFGVGAALVPSGLVLLGRTDGISRALVIGMIVGGSAQLLSVPLLFIPTRMDEIHDKFMDRPANVESKASIHAIEEEWRGAAEASRSRRAFVGTTMLIAGGVSLATGLSLLLAPAGFLGMSRKTQYTTGGVMMGTGMPVLTISVRFLIEWSAEETSWEAYRTMKSDANRLARLRRPSFGVAPFRDGAMAVATVPF